MAESIRGVRLTKEIIAQLKKKGYRYVLIKGYTPSRRSDYIELDSFKLTPVKELPEDPAEKEIYAPLDSKILLDWATPENGVEAFIDPEA